MPKGRMRDETASLDIPRNTAVPDNGPMADRPSATIKRGLNHETSSADPPNL
jgi:hypothetical protein